MKGISRIPRLFLILISILAAPAAQAMQITITNLTNGVYFSPLLVTAHSTSVKIFTAGETASNALRAMAEGGTISSLSAQVGGADADTIEDPANGYLEPGEAVTFTLSPFANNTRLSVVGKMNPTNDGFVGLDSLELPTAKGSYYLYFNAYDAGTEANNELMNTSTGGQTGVLGIPFAPGGGVGAGGSGVTTVEHNTTVHFHRGVMGDTTNAGGKSDLSSTIHRWLNPVARMDIVIN